MDWKIANDQLIITIDIGKAAIDRAPSSSSGKTYLVATTSGAVNIPAHHCRELKLGLNLMAKK